MYSETAAMAIIMGTTHNNSSCAVLPDPQTSFHVKNQHKTKKLVFPNEVNVCNAFETVSSRSVETHF